MKSPDLFEYSSYISYLNDYFKYKVGTNSKFNYSMWARKLKFANAATLTRILNGDRLPGASAINAFCDYLEIQGDEREYFESLIRLEKEEVPQVRHLFENKIFDLRQKRLQPLLHTKAKNLIVWGTVDRKAFDELLAPHGFESILSYAGSTSSVCLNGALVRESEIGSYTQFCIACYTKKIGQPLAESEMFFLRLASSDKEISEKFQAWESPYEHFDMKSNLGYPDT
ncbi:MAG: hypothetical protein AB7O96_07360, partial [Pseudobdellovibrionaceae bacterium]